jgi:hypothetical protein
VTTNPKMPPNPSLASPSCLTASEAELTDICPDGIGLTTALIVHRSGWVIVGSLPTSDGSSAPARGGCLLVLDNQGRVVESIGRVRQR